MKPKGVTTQMKALNEYFLMVVFTLLLNRVHCTFYVEFEQRNVAMKALKCNVCVMHITCRTVTPGSTRTLLSSTNTSIISGTGADVAYCWAIIEVKVSPHARL